MYMMENNQIRQIKIDPELLKISNNNGGSKRKHSTSEKSIRVRDSIKPKDHNKTTKRNALLKFIRRHQSKNAQQLLEGNDTLTNINAITSLPRNEIDETLEYLMGVADEVKKKEPLSERFVPNSQYTLKHDHKPTNNSIRARGLDYSWSMTDKEINPSPEGADLNLLRFKSSENVSMKFPDSSGDRRSPSASFLNQPEPSNIVLNHRHLVGGEHPKYGCLRSGELPTYRQLQKQQQQQQPHFPKGWQGANTNFAGNHRPMPSPNSSGDLRSPSAPFSTQIEAFSSLPDRNDYVFGEGGNVKHSAESTTKLSEKDPTNIQLKIMRQRRTSRRTFKIGKSKTRPKVGVLISNRTIRKNIATNALLLKQVPMTEIRRYLVKHNLITVGSNAPDYILRKMYETSNTVCGEIFNHNNENLLHNFFHGKDDI